MEAVHILLNGDKPNDWRACVNMFRRPNFVQDLVCFDIDQISDTTMQKLEPYINSAEFNPREMAKSSVPASALCKWVHAVYNYQLMKEAI
jgi:dynein heavy chain